MFTFQKIGNYRSRRQILSEVIKKRAPAMSAEFRNSFIKELQRIDEKRNSITHWTNGHLILEGEERWFLVPPGKGVTNAYISIPELQSYGLKLKLFFHLAHLIVSEINSRYPDPETKAIANRQFQTAISYPLSPENPLSEIFPAHVRK